MVCADANILVRFIMKDNMELAQTAPKTCPDKNRNYFAQKPLLFWLKTVRVYIYKP